MLKRFLIILIPLFLFSPTFAVGYNVNFGLNTGITECVGGENIQKNVNVWDADKHYFDYFNAGGYITTDFVLTHRFSLETGFSYKLLNLHYTTTEENFYGNDVCHINYSVIQMPVMAKYIFPIIKSAEIINSINLGAGLNVSYIVGKQVYSDSMTNYYGNFITPKFNIGAVLKATYSHKIGPGYAFIGLNSEIDFIPHSYSINERKVNIGNTLSINPVIGYKFIIYEDKNLAKITEKNKRIRDLVVK